MYKKTMAWVGVLAILCLVAVGIALAWGSGFVDPKPNGQENPLFRVGQMVGDSEGNLWEYGGNWIIVAGQVSTTGQVLSLKTCGGEHPVIMFHPESVAGAKPGDVFHLKTMSAKFYREVKAAWLFDEECNPDSRGWCNVVMQDPPARYNPYDGTLSCARMYCGDLPLLHKPAK